MRLTTKNDVSMARMPILPSCVRTSAASTKKSTISCFVDAAGTLPWLTPLSEKLPVCCPKSGRLFRVKPKPQDPTIPAVWCLCAPRDFPAARLYAQTPGDPATPNKSRLIFSSPSRATDCRLGHGDPEPSTHLVRTSAASTQLQLRPTAIADCPGVLVAHPQPELEPDVRSRSSLDQPFATVSDLALHYRALILATEMPSISAAQQKVLVAQFVSLTGASERQATRYLKSTGFKINEAVDAFFSSGAEVRGPSPVEAKLESLFDSLRATDDQNDEKNKLELDSTMGYLSNKLRINLENAELFVILELLQAPSVGEIARKGYVDGWKSTAVGATHQEHSAYIRRLVATLSTDQALFRKVYRYAFIVGRERDQKALSVDNAVIYWSMLFAPPGMIWKTKAQDWFELWKSFLSEKWTRSVNKDMWDMTLKFALEAMADESLSFWRPEAAWPSVIDDFVIWCREKGVVKDESMEVDADS
ncbi:hypothetical protein HIM_08543 [Hirsutella minnesotensis 3608]|uniref:Defective in cullin neddylation protein n=1 Tax=Hirsutella minnesotensis 3608 TaxID=1043627 RepID=A0A0F7ZSW8_9HYPO|nr:hypothetical protein HIM_08543 [Hirsutella minnesotensis 3608]